ncbi:hypothetical protein EON67_04625 [archaeon]|nr:MAG: hypothetical protein EON67_04625 [archaeon]
MRGATILYVCTPVRFSNCSVPPPAVLRGSHPYTLRRVCAGVLQTIDGDDASYITWDLAFKPGA